MIKLSKRLEVISSLIPHNVNIADIGCDHGLLSIHLYQTKKANKIIAADINENALSNAKKNLEKYELTNFIETRLGDGLDIINETDDINCLVIAGMGEQTIVNMLQKNYRKLSKITTMVIQSNTKIEFLRREVVKLGYQINDEAIVLDNNKIYIIIKFTIGKKKYTNKEYYFGPVLLKNNSDLFQQYQKQELTKLFNIKKQIPKYKILAHYQINKKIRLYH